MATEAGEVGRMTDVYGYEIAFGAEGDGTTWVQFIKPGGDYIGIHLYAAQQEEFAQLFVEASWQAKANAEQARKASV